MYKGQLTLPRKCEEIAVLKNTAIRRHAGGFLPRAADWREGGKRAILNVA